MRKRGIAAGLLSVGLCLTQTDVGFAQDYPTKPIRMLTASVGGATDFVARLVGQGLVTSLGQQVVIDNRPATLHGPILSKAPPDGYDLLMSGESVWMQTLLEKKPYDVSRDFAAVILIGNAPNLLVVNPSVAAKSVKEFIDLAKSKPGELNYASGVSAGSTHLAGELLKSLAGINVVRVPYKGTGELLNALIGGQGVHFTIASVPSVVPHIKAGRLRPLGITSLTRSPTFPGLPTIAESVPGYESGGQTALFAPAHTPSAIIARLNRETARFISTSEVKERFLAFGIDAIGGSPQDLNAFVTSELVKWGKIIKDAGITAE